MAPVALLTLQIVKKNEFVIERLRNYYDDCGCGLTLVDFHICQRLPLIHGNEPFVLLAATAEIDDQLALVPAKSPKNSIQPLLAEMAIREEVRCDDDLVRSIRVNSSKLGCQNGVYTYLFCSPINPLLCIRIINTASHLEPARPCLQRLSSSDIVSSAQHNHMGALELTVSVQLRKILWRMLRHMVCLEGRRRAVQGTADNLLHLAGMEVYAGTKARHGDMKHPIPRAICR